MHRISAVPLPCPRSADDVRIALSGNARRSGPDRVLEAPFLPPAARSRDVRFSRPLTRGAPVDEASSKCRSSRSRTQALDEAPERPRERITTARPSSNGPFERCREQRHGPGAPAGQRAERPGRRVLERRGWSRATASGVAGRRGAGSVGDAITWCCERATGPLSRRSASTTGVCSGRQSHGTHRVRLCGGCTGRPRPADRRTATPARPRGVAMSPRRSAPVAAARRRSCR